MDKNTTNEFTGKFIGKFVEIKSFEKLAEKWGNEEAAELFPWKVVFILNKVIEDDSDYDYNDIQSIYNPVLIWNIDEKKESVDMYSNFGVQILGTDIERILSYEEYSNLYSKELIEELVILAVKKSSSSIEVMYRLKDFWSAEFGINKDNIKEYIYLNKADLDKYKDFLYHSNIKGISSLLSWKPNETNLQNFLVVWRRKQRSKYYSIF